MSETKKRVFWTQQEKQAVADEMQRLLESDPLQSKLQAVLKAQQVLPAERRRVVPAWTTVQEQIEPHLKIARANALAASRRAEEQAATAPAPAEAARGDEAGSTGTREAGSTAALASGPAPAGDGLAAGGLAALLAQQVDLLTRLGAAVLSEAIVQALSSPAVEARLAGLVQSALAQAGGTAGAAGPARTAGPLQAAPSKPKVLLAGLQPAQANELSEEFAQTLDIRHWRNGETAEQLRSLARHCAVAVAMTDAVDPATESLLRSMPLRFIRQSGGLDRLKERLHELIDHGVFNLLSS